MIKKRLMHYVTALLFAVSCMSVTAASQTSQTPPWLKFLGFGINPFTCTSGRCNITDEIWFTSFYVAPGAIVVNAGGNGPLIIRSTGTCTIAGTVIGNGSLTYGSGITGNGDFGGGGGGGGGGTYGGIAGRTTVVIQGIPIINGGAGGSAGGGNGGTATSASFNQYRAFLANGSSWPGGGGAGGNGGSGGALGGNGGTPVIFICNTINFTGTIDVSGGAGGNSNANNTGAGGGGGAGYVILAAVNFAANSGTINVTGGAGGTCSGHSNCGSGGAGGNGWSATVDIQ